MEKYLMEFRKGIFVSSDRLVKCRGVLVFVDFCKVLLLLGYGNTGGR